MKILNQLNDRHSRIQTKRGDRRGTALQYRLLCSFCRASRKVIIICLFIQALNREKTAFQKAKWLWR